MSWFSVDVEGDGPFPGMYSMVCFGATKVSAELDMTFYGETAPVSDRWDPEALAISGFTREQHLAFEQPETTIPRFVEWVESVSVGRPILISDNPAYDWQWINSYCHMFAGRNPFGYSARRIGDIYSGLVGDTYRSSEWKRFRETTHDHNPLNDSMGNAQAILTIGERFNLKIPGVKR